jgi:hypothetical protein
MSYIYGFKNTDSTVLGTVIGVNCGSQIQNIADRLLKYDA